MASPYEIAATGLKTIIDGEFSTETFTAVHDKLHESLGRERTDIGISPIREVPLPGNELVLQNFILVQFYLPWKQEIDPNTQVNPIQISQHADRFRTAAEAQQATFAGTNQTWYYKVTQVEYPDDPTGNKTRFHATVVGYGDNTALVNR